MQRCCGLPYHTPKSLCRRLSRSRQRKVTAGQRLIDNPAPRFHKKGVHRSSIHTFSIQWSQPTSEQIVQGVEKELNQSAADLTDLDAVR